MNELKVYKSKKEPNWCVAKNGIFYEFDEKNGCRLRKVCFSMHIDWDSFTDEYEEIEIEKLPEYLQDVLEKEGLKGTI